MVIGSSAGGIDALSVLVSTLPDDFPAPIVIAQHLDPKRPSTLPTILARRSTLPVRAVEDHAQLEPGVIYVVPANRHVLINDSTIDLRVDGTGRPIPSVNLLLETAAEAYGDQLIAVILTGLGSDGASGAHTVKKLGGTVVIQNPETATHPAMPRSLAPNTVDVVADLERIGPILYDLLNGVQVPTRPEDDETLGTFLERVREQNGIDFSTYKPPTIRRRLQRRIVATGTVNIAGYLAYLEAHPEEYQQLVSTFLIKVTEFFRDPELFAYLRETVLPELIAHAERRDRELRIWSAGCATGEEAYSLAILVAEVLGHDLADWNIRIFSTDLDAEAINFARQGIYSAASVEGLPDDLLARCFTVEDNVYQIRKHIRALTVFGQHDLGQRAPFPRIDLVVCRNVLIYFTQELQKRALQLFAYSLRDQGLLVLGKAESTSPLGEFFSLQHHQLKVYRRHGERILMPAARVLYPTPHAPQRFPSSSRGGPGPVPARLPRGEQRPPSRDESYLLKLPVGMVVVDRRYDIQSINGVARQLLAIYNVAIGDDLIHIAQGVPSQQLRQAIDRSFRTGGPTSLEPFVAEDPVTDTRRHLQIACYPQRADDDRSPLETVLLVVNDVTDTMRQDSSQETAISAGTPAQASPEERARQQERQIGQLSDTNRQLMEANQDLLSTNEELRTANEEFLLSVEEAQASTEEIETLNEEMQATNEELETLNEELQATVEELNTTNDELHARSIELQEVAQTSEEERARLAVILNTMGDAILVLNRDGSILLANAAYERLFGPPPPTLEMRDLDGRPLARQERPVERALLGNAFSMEFTTTGPEGEQRWFEADSRPVFDADRRLQWSILAIRDITDRSLQRLQEQFLSLASHELRTPLTSLQGYLQMLERQFRDPPLPAQARRYVGSALSQVERLKRLITDLLDVVRLQNGKLAITLQPVSLNEVATQSVEVARLMTALPINLAAPATALRVNGDAGRLEQILLNLLLNAIVHARGTDRVDLRLRQDGATAEIQVQDYGAGIPQANLPNLFTRFFQVARSDTPAQHGLGLGLFLVRELVEAHHGTITAASEEGKGSTFTIRLPLLPAPPTENSAAGVAR
ncbi:MAG: CheR family methyltransferase [Thermomicrobiales bacterium]